LGWQGAKVIKKDENGHAKIDDSKRIDTIPGISDTNRVVLKVAENK